MDGNPLSNQQQMQADEVSRAYLQDTAGEQQRKLEKLDAACANAHNRLVSFLTLLDPDFIDTCLKQGKLIHQLDDRNVQQRVILAIKALQEKVSLGACHDQPVQAGSFDENKRLMEENQWLLSQLEQAQNDIRFLSTGPVRRRTGKLLVFLTKLLDRLAWQVSGRIPYSGSK